MTLYLDTWREVTCGVCGKMLAVEVLSRSKVYCDWRDYHHRHAQLSSTDPIVNFVNTENIARMPSDYFAHEDVE